MRGYSPDWFAEQYVKPGDRVRDICLWAGVLHPRGFHIILMRSLTPVLTGEQRWCVVCADKNAGA